MRAILVCVNYADVLSLTLPYNRHHFESVHVVTSPADEATQRLCRELGAHCFVTDAFCRDGAIFAKWRALEEGLDAMGRHGWLCVMDADVLWPKVVPQSVLGMDLFGRLTTPLRRMYPAIPKTAADVPPESEWPRYPLHRNVGEWAGYSQIFHADDPALGPPPWHETNWKHAGGADSFFQAKWPRERKLRPPFEVLHLGPAGANWFGRENPDAARLTRELWERRRAARGTADPFPGERTA